MAPQKQLLLGNPNELKMFFYNELPTTSELRFPSVTAMKGHFAVNMIIYNAETDSVLLSVYNTRLSHLLKDEIETDETISDTSETPFTVLQAGILKETGLEALSAKMLGMPIEVKNTNPVVDSDIHERYVILVEKYNGSVRTYDEILSPKNGQLVWIRSYLLRMVFDQHRVTAGIDETTKPHPHLEAYKRFVGYYNNKLRHANFKNKIR